MSALNKPTWKRRIRRGASVLLISLIALCLFRNPIAKLALIRLAPSIAGIDLKVDGIRIGWTTVEIIGVRIDEQAATDLPQLETDNVRIAFTLQDGFRSGSWAKRVDVFRPTLHLRFDEAGKLISKFPEISSETGGNSAIPIRELLVRDAAIVIHRRGSQPFTVDGMKMVGQFGNSIRIRGELPKLFGGSVVVQADLNAATLAGQSKLTIENIALDSNQLNELPILPDSIRQLGLSACLSASAEIEHPTDPLDLGRYEAKLVSVLQHVQSTKHGSILDRVECFATSVNGTVKVSVGGDLLAGKIDALLRTDLKQNPISADATLTVRSWDLRAIGAEFVPDVQLDAKTSLSAKAHLTYDHQKFAFTSELNATANSISILDLPVDDILVTASASGVVPVSDLTSYSGLVEGTVESQGVAMSKVAKRFQLPAATGRVAANAEFAIPLRRITEPEFYSVKANIRTTDVSIGEFTLNDSTVALAVENAVAEIGMSNAIIRDPQSSRVLSCAAGAKANLTAGGKVGAAVDVVFSPTQTLFAALGISDLEPTGTIRFTGSAQNQLDRATQPEKWTVMTTIQGADLSIAGEMFGDLQAKCELADGNLVVPQFEFPWRNNKCVVSGNGCIAGGLAFDGTVYSDSIQIEDIALVASRLSKQRLAASGIAKIGGGVRLNVPDWKFESADVRASGRAQISGAHFGTTEIGELELAWEANPDSLIVKSGSSDFFGGSYGIDATMHNLDWTKTVVNGQFRGVHASRLVALSKVRMPVSGVFDGGIELTEIGSLDSAKGSAWVTSRGITAQRLPVEISNSHLTMESGFVDFTSEGNVSRGRFAAKARASLGGLLEFVKSERQQVERIPIIVDAQLTDFPVNILNEVLPLPAELRSLQGKVSATLNRGIPVLDGHTVCDVTCTLENLQLNQVRLADRITGEISVQHDRVSLSRIAGRLADGRLSGRAELSLSANPTGTFELAANRMSLRRLGKAVAIDQDLSGSGTVSIRGKLGQQISGRADLKLDHGVLAGVSVREANFPVDWSYSQPSRIARWQCRAGLVSLGGGKVRVASEGSYGSSLTMSTEARVERVNSSKLIVGKSIGAGTITGNVNINAKRARSPKQFTGRFDFDLANPKTFELPVLNQLPTVVSLTPPRPGVGKDGGYVVGRFAGGLVHVDQLAIVQSNVQVLMSGNTTQEGRLDFDVTVNTNASGPAEQLLELANTPLMLAAPAPVALIAKANDLLKDRVVHVHVGGIAARPTIQLQPGKQLSQNAVKFFLTNALGSQAAEFATRRTQTKRR